MSKECESQSELIKKIEEIADMEYDKIKYIVSEEEQYPVESKSLEVILYDLEYNDFTVVPF